jgi:hypothetical protein
MVDKDLSSIKLILQFFNAIILLCTFHVVKYFKKQIGEEEMQVPNDKISELYEILNKCVYTNR